MMKKRTGVTISDITRRRFLKLSGGALAACGAPMIVPSTVLGAFAPSERINVGFIGLGNQSRGVVPAFLCNDDVQAVAVCDVNRGSNHYLEPSHFLGREPGQKTVNDYYAQKMGVGAYKGCDAYNDFRDVLGRSDVDAVTVVVPDHWHAPITVMAAKAGKDIYCEKPLSLTVRQGQQMIKAVRENHRVFQTGSMYRSNPYLRRGCEMVRNGRIGQLTKIIVDVNRNNFQGPGPGWQPMPVPEGFDYDMWLGPAPLAPYHIDRCLYRFRFILDYSGGQITNTGHHTHDAGQWGGGFDGTGPVEFEDRGSEWPEPGSLYTTATKTHYAARYANGVQLECGVSDNPHALVRFFGTEGWVDVSDVGIQAAPASLVDTTIGPNEIHLPVSNNEHQNDPLEFNGQEPGRKPHDRLTAMKYYLPDHARNFLDCIKSRHDPIAPVEVGHRSVSVCHLGNIAMRLKRKIRWDPEKQEIIGDDEAAAMLSRPLRAPWTI
jgi:predicted dehydrogenase